MKVGTRVKVLTRKHTGVLREEIRGGVKITSADAEEFTPLEEDLTFIVAGIDHLGRIWLSAEEAEYDGYNGDLIVRKADGNGIYEVGLADDRNTFGFEVKIKKAR